MEQLMTQGEISGEVIFTEIAFLFLFFWKSLLTNVRSVNLFNKNVIKAKEKKKKMKSNNM